MIPAYNAGMNADSNLTSNTPAISNPSPSPRRKGRWRWLLVLPVLVLLMLAALPTLIGSRWVYQKLVDRLAIEGFRLQIDAAEIGWLRPIAFRGIRLEQLAAPKSSSESASKKLDLLAIEAIESNRSLFGYLVGGRDLGRIRIIKPQIDIELLENTSNLEKLAKALPGDVLTTDSKVQKAPPRIDLEIAVERMSVAVAGEDRDMSLMVVPPFDASVQYRALDGRSRLIVAPSKILSQVSITQELVRLGLGRAVPLLAKSAWFDGSVSLETQGIEIPLEAPAESTGHAILTLHQVRTGPSEPVLLNILDMIAKFRKKEPVHELVFIDGSQILVSAKEGKIEHEGVKIGLPKIDPRLQLTSKGEVGIIDRSLGIQIGLPVPVELLARRASVQGIGIPQLSLPVCGTLDDPVVDWKAMRHESSDLLALISAALGEEAPGTAAAFDALSSVTEGKADEAIGAAVDMLKELRRLRQERKEKAAADSDSDSGPEAETSEEKDDPTSPPRRLLRNALRNILGGN